MTSCVLDVVLIFALALVPPDQVRVLGEVEEQHLEAKKTLLAWHMRVRIMELGTDETCAAAPRSTTSGGFALLPGRRC